MHHSRRMYLAALFASVAITAASQASAAEEGKKTEQVTFNVSGMT